MSLLKVGWYTTDGVGGKYTTRRSKILKYSSAEVTDKNQDGGNIALT